MRVVVMGVAGCGKSRVGAALADRLGLPFVDGDDLHPPENVEKMSAGLPLDDADRAPWLARVGARLREGAAVVACSALKRRYREAIRAGAGAPVAFVHLAGDRALIARRLAARPGHFMPPSLLDSQFAALEPLGPDEGGIVVRIDRPVAEVVGAAAAALGADGA